MSAATKLELDPTNPPNFATPQTDAAESAAYRSYTTELVPATETANMQKAFTVNVSAKGATVDIPLGKLFGTGSFALTGLSLRGHKLTTGQTLEVQTDKGEPLFPSSFHWESNELKQRHAIDLGSLPSDVETPVFERKLGPYAGITTADVTKGVEIVNVDGYGKMASIPLPPKSGSFFVHALENSHNGEPAVLAPGTLEQNRNPLQPESHFLLPLKNYKEVVQAYETAAQRDGGMFSSAAMRLSFGPNPENKDVVVSVNAKVQPRPSEVNFQLSEVALEGEEEI